MITESFANGVSPIHRLDPRFKIVFVVLYSFVAALSYQTPVLIAALIVSLLLVAFSRLNPWDVCKRLVIVFGFILFLWIMVPLTFGGEAIYRLGPISISRPGVIFSVRITLKSTAILLAFIALAATMDLSTMGRALSRLKVPRKIVHLLLMTYRYISVMQQEYQRLLRSAKIRGFTPSTSMHTYKTFAYLIGMLFVRASTRAERVHNAMKCRGFKGKFYTLADFPVTPANWVFAAIMTIVLAGLVYLEWRPWN
ncbi:MAG: cobalt ECF transporter T component CbiQ [Desulfobacterales bacterium]|nr:cobalt ECF transporter T component CbiQ [Desulfobacterales bacterium]